jgi:hypothetical protein
MFALFRTPCRAGRNWSFSAAIKSLPLNMRRPDLPPQSRAPTP